MLDKYAAALSLRLTSPVSHTEIVSSAFCSECGKAFTAEDPGISHGDRLVCLADHMVLGSPHIGRAPTPTSPDPVAGMGAASVLRFFAWADLVASFVIAVWVLSTFSVVDVPNEFIPGMSSRENNPIAMAVAIGVVLQGAFVCALFLAVASMADNLAAIRRNTAR